MDSFGALIEKVRRKKAILAVVGLGYVGLPLAVAFAEAGVRVLGIDVDGKRVQAINRGESHIPDVPSATLAPLVASPLARPTRTARPPTPWSSASPPPSPG